MVESPEDGSIRNGGFNGSSGAVSLPSDGSRSCGSSAGQMLAAVEQPIQVSTDVVAATVDGKAVVQVERFGRYSLSVKSDTGVAVQVVDRMAGPGAISGVAGEQDGRVDLFLDRGKVLLRTFGHKKGTGDARISARAFTEVNPLPAPQLEPLTFVEATLADLEQRSYWLVIDAPQWVYLEAAGRALADMRLWKDGSWLVDAEPSNEVMPAREGEPLLAVQDSDQTRVGSVSRDAVWRRGAAVGGRKRRAAACI